ncbi:MAG: insulinase family protein [Acidobacteria bacterium]|nr:insulinase family protein [Acidobacteriota bacterium]
MKRSIVLWFILLVFTSLAAGEITLDVQEHVLDNGLKILMIPQPGAPLVTCHLYYKAGSVNERPGITGIAHLHEHMMFKGTKIMGVTDYEKDAAIDRQIDAIMDKIYREMHWTADGGDPAKIAEWKKEYEELVASEKPYIVKDALWELYMKNGGTGLNASTGNEMTGYYVTLPANKVELQMLLESDRMANAYFREFYSEKDVVMEERRLSENRAGYLFGEQVNAAFYVATPYHWGVIGWMDDLRKITKNDLIEFNQTYYIPNNAVAVYVGDFDPADIIAMAEKYFGRVPCGKDVEPIRTYVPPQDCEKRIYGKGNAPTSLQIMFHIPPAGHPDTAPLSILAAVLGSGGGGGRRFGGGGGMTGRLPKILIKEKELAVSVSAFSRPQWYAGVFQFRAMPRFDRNVPLEDLEKAVWEEIARIQQDGVTEEEIQMAQNRSEAMFVRSLSMSRGVARRVAEAELTRGWRSLLTDLEALQQVTSDDIKRVAAHYLVKNNSLTALYEREGGGPRRGPGRRPGGRPDGPPRGQSNAEQGGVE